MFHVVLYEPEIPPNTGNIIRLCANTGCQLHLIEPLGFDLDDAKLKRAGLDYHEFAAVKIYNSLAVFLLSVQPSRIFGLSTHGTRSFYECEFHPGDAFVFGPETRGLPKEVRESLSETSAETTQAFLGEEGRDLFVKIDDGIQDFLLFFGKGHVHLTSDRSLLWYLDILSLGTFGRSGI